MNRLIIIAFSILAIFSATAQSNQWFAYPSPPESLAPGRQRANYMVEHFWDYCPWKTVYTSPAKMEQTLRDFADFLPIAQVDTVFASIDKLISNTSKRPADMATLLKIAEATFYSDTAYAFSDQVFLPFAKAGSEFKKFSSEDRERYQTAARKIENTMIGNKLPALSVTLADGSKRALNDTTPDAATYIYIFEKPGDVIGRLDRVMFTANIAAQKLINSGIVKPMLILCGEPDDAWWKDVSTLPAQWTVGYMADAEDQFDLRTNPGVIIADDKSVISGKDLPIGMLIGNFERLLLTLESNAQ